MRFTAELAGVPVEIHCEYPENRAFLRDYWTDRPPQAAVAPGPEDREEMRQALVRQEGAQDFAPWFLENNALHWRLTERLTEYGVLLVHGSAVALDGAAYLFTARSGTGKSTHTRLWRTRFPGAFMVNDDKPLLKVTEEGVLVYGSPWDGKHRLSRNTSVPLRAAAELYRDAANHVDPCADPLGTLYQYALRSRDPALMRRILRLEGEIVRQVPFYRLGCNMDPAAAETAYAGMRQETRTVQMSAPAGAQASALPSALPLGAERL